MRPPQRPTNVHPKASTGVFSYKAIKKVSGREIIAATYKRGVKSTVEMINCHFKVDSIFSFWSTAIIFVAAKEVKKDPIKPKAEIMRG